MAGEMVWIDLEMTGLNLDSESIIEIATIVTDGELNITAMGPNLAIKVSEELLGNMDEWNTTHHTASGLVDRIRSEGVSLEEAIKQTCAFLKENIDTGASPLCGNSIHTDRAFLAKEMPEILDLLHYRIVDVSSIKELSNRWYPNNPRYDKKEAHRALDDIIESIEELRHYRATLFRD
ncbi:MAG: oligoribonuclease [Euryarchaeota archaeon]|jgi:oligoribonuclease|nr:oligoribonuclease [Euryarchaeota archaeon]MBT5184328.1 oligoribonuclease [Euryarchaeota archaeon]